MIVPSRGLCLGSHLDKTRTSEKKRKSVVCVGWRLERRSGFCWDFSEEQEQFLVQDFPAGAAREGCGAQAGRCWTGIFLPETAFPASSRLSSVSAAPAGPRLTFCGQRSCLVGQGLVAFGASRLPLLLCCLGTNGGTSEGQSCLGLSVSRGFPWKLSLHSVESLRTKPSYNFMPSCTDTSLLKPCK